MSAFDIFWNLSQESDINDINDEIAQLKKQVSLLKEWIDYLNKQVEELKK